MCQLVAQKSHPASGRCLPGAALTLADVVTGAPPGPLPGPVTTLPDTVDGLIGAEKLVDWMVVIPPPVEQLPTTS